MTVTKSLLRLEMMRLGDGDKLFSLSNKLMVEGKEQNENRRVHLIFVYVVKTEV